MMVYKKKGQAAMEYLLTYGLAILAVVLIISALIYFDVLNPRQFLPDKCQVSEPFSCKGAQATTEDTVTISVVNAGSSILEYKLDGSEVFIPELDETCEASTTDETLPAGNEFNIEFECGDDTLAGLSGQKLSMDLTLKYVDKSTDFTHRKSGTIVATVESDA